REKFTVKSQPSKPDPCIIYGEPTPLTAAELDKLSKKQSRKALSGYRVAITVRERSGDHQLDIGPFRREVVWESNAGKEPCPVHVQGVVRGEVNAFVAGNPDTPRLHMGIVNPAGTQQFKIRLETVNPQVEVTLDDRTTNFLKVDVVDGKEGKKEIFGDGSTRKTWTVYVSIRPDANYFGPFPDLEKPGYESCAVVFKITHAGATNEQPRRLKVPVAGQ